MCKIYSPVLFIAPAEAVPRWNFVTAVGPKTRMMLLPECQKCYVMSIRFNRVPALDTDRQTDGEIW